MIKQLILHIAIIFYFAVSSVDSQSFYEDPNPIVLRIDSPDTSDLLRKKPLKLRAGSLIEL
jgi:hypothetical protein